MRALVPALAFVLASSSTFAQAPATPPAPKLFASAGDVTALIANAKKERKPDQPNFSQPILQARALQRESRVPRSRPQRTRLGPRKRGRDVPGG